MYETLIGKITTTLGEIENVKDVFSTPKSKLTKFPAVFFKPDGFSNAFETGNENMKIYRFMMLVLIGSNKNMTLENIFSTVLPHTVDAIVAKFDADWDQGTIGGHRVRVKVDSAGAWEVEEGEDGLTAYAPLNVEIRVLSNN